LIDLLEQLNPVPRTIILNMEHVPLIDSSGESALRGFLTRCQKKNIFVVFSGLQHRPMKIMNRMGIGGGAGEHYVFADNFDEAIAKAK
jgi:sulfate permease, SulP family